MRDVQENANSRNLKTWQLAIGSLALLTIGATDAIAKVLALKYLPNEQVAQLQPVFSFAIHKNPGILFDIPLPITVIAPLTIIALIALTSLAWRAAKTQPLVLLGALAAITGALNNLLDRLFNGFTTDYLIFFRLSAINLSDVLIFLGIIFLLWYSRNNSPNALSKVEGHAQQK